MAEGVSGETEMTIAVSSMFPGFRFSPTDIELISFYLKKKLEGSENCVEVISEVEICKFEPWDLPAQSVIKSDNEWFFFCARGRKYPNGSQSKRATEMGYWKATGKERNVKSGNNVIGTKRTLVFHIGRAPKGERTEWIMHEYCMEGRSQDALVVCRLRKNSDFRLNNTSNQASGSRRLLDNSYAVSEGGTDVTGTSEGDKAVESCSKKCSSSHDSYSMEQADSASEAEQKLLDDVNLTASSSHHKDIDDDDDDFFAEILKDDIIKLDETSLSTTRSLPPIVTSEMEAERKSQQPMEAVQFEAVPLQGTANPFLAANQLPLSTTPSLPQMVISEMDAERNSQQPMEAVQFAAVPLQGTANPFLAANQLPLSTTPSLPTMVTSEMEAERNSQQLMEAVQFAAVPLQGTANPFLAANQLPLSITHDHPTMVAREMEAERSSQQAVEAVQFPAVPFQGTANPFLAANHMQAALSQGTAKRRIKLGKQKPKLSRFGQYFEDNSKSQRSEQSPNCLLTCFASMTIRQRLTSVVLGILILLALVLFIFRGFWPVKNFEHATLNKDFSG